MFDKGDSLLAEPKALGMTEERVFLDTRLNLILPIIRNLTQEPPLPLLRMLMSESMR